MSRAPSPLSFTWQGDGFTPLPRCQAECDRRYIVGRIYRLMEWEDRSPASHSHQFAWLHEAWANLPEDLRDLYPTAEHLRKRALIQAGFYDEEIIDTGSATAALRVGAFVHKSDEFAVVILRGPLVIVRSAKSQSHRSMDRATFQRSKDAVLEIVAGLIGVTPAELQANTGKAA